MNSPHPRHARVGSFFFRYRNAIGPALFLFALFSGKPTYPFGRADLNMVFDVAGIVIALLGQALRIVTIGFAYIERGGRNRQVYASELVQGGVFGHCRNPLYVGNILLALGLALVLNSWAFYLVVVPLVVYAYSAIVAAEENFLRDRFGAEYDVYCHRVNRWVPKLAGWRASVEDMTFNWRRVVVKEYNTIFLVILALALVKVWSDYQVQGRDALAHQGALATALSLWIVAYLCVRTMKKSGYLQA